MKPSNVWDVYTVDNYYNFGPKLDTISLSEVDDDWEQNLLAKLPPSDEALEVYESELGLIFVVTTDTKVYALVNESINKA